MRLRRPEGIFRGGIARCTTRRMIGEINEHLRGWANYFGRGYPRKAFREINHCVRDRLCCRLSRRSQRPWQPRKDTTHYEQFKKMGLIYL